MPAGAQADWHGSPAHVQCFSCWNGEQMTLMSFSNVIVAWLMHWGKGIKEKCARALGLSSGFWNWTFQSIVKKSLTLYHSCFSVSCGVGVYPSRVECLVYSSAVPRLAWDILSYYDFSCLLVIWVVSLPQSTWTHYWRRHGSQPFAVDCIGGINC